MSFTSNCASGSRESLVKKKPHPGQVDGFAVMIYMPNMLSAHCDIGLGDLLNVLKLFTMLLLVL